MAHCPQPPGSALARSAHAGPRTCAAPRSRRLARRPRTMCGQDPCLDAFSSGRAVQANAAYSRARWPVFRPRASGEGFQVMCAVPTARAHARYRRPEPVPRQRRAIHRYRDRDVCPATSQQHAEPMRPADYSRRSGSVRSFPRRSPHTISTASTATLHVPGVAC
jgi:hypothetical protein